MGASGLQLRFLKDSVYGTLITLIFVSFGWNEKNLVALHLLSLPCIFLAPLLVAEDTPAWLVKTSMTACIAASALVALADTVVVLMLSCAVKKCCLDGSTTSPFSLGMKVCNAESGRVDAQILAVAAMVTVGVGALQSCLRLSTLSSMDEGPAYMLPMAYLLIRTYQLTWLAGGVSMLGIGVFWALNAATALAAVVTSIFLPNVGRWLYLGTLVLDFGAFVVALTPLVPETVRLAATIIQGVSLAIAISLTWKAFTARGKEKEKDDTETMPPKGRRYKTSLAL